MSNVNAMEIFVAVVEAKGSRATAGCEKVVTDLGDARLFRTFYSAARAPMV